MDITLPYMESCVKILDNKRNVPLLRLGLIFFKMAETERMMD